MRIIKSIASHKGFLLYLIIANLLFIAANTLLLMHIFNNPSDRFFPLIHSDWWHDYYSLLGFITEGQSGLWLKREQYTTEPIPPSLLHVFYIVLGHIAAWIHIPSYLMYHIGRIFVVELFIIALYIIARQILGKRYAFWGGFLALIGTTLPQQFIAQKVMLWTYPGGIPWWITQDALERLNNYPHHIFGHAMLLISFIFLFAAINSPNIWYTVASCLAIAIGSLMFPPILAALLVCIPCAWVIRSIQHIIRQRKFSLPLRPLITTLIVTICAGLTYKFLKMQLIESNVGGTVVSYEVVRWNQLEIGFVDTMLRTFGILPLLALPAWIRNFIKGTYQEILINLWAILPLLLLPFVNFLAIPQIRLLQTAPFVPLGILAAQSIFILLLPTSPRSRKSLLLQIPIILIFLVSTLPISYELLRQRIDTYDYYAVGHQYHLPIKTYESLQFIAQNVPKNSKILSDQMVGNMIPAFSPTIVYVGHFVGTKNIWGKLGMVRNFYTHTMTEEEAKQFIKENDLTYVYWGETEKTLNSKPLPYSFLQPIFNNTDVVIYKVN